MITEKGGGKQTLLLKTWRQYNERVHERQRLINLLVSWPGEEGLC